jgi:hypothetical protein
MVLNAMNVCCNLVLIFVSLLSIFNFNFNRQYSSLNCHSEIRQVGKGHRAQFKPNLERFE